LTTFFVPVALQATTLTAVANDAQSRALAEKEKMVKEKELKVREEAADASLEKQKAAREAKRKADAEASEATQGRELFHSLYRSGDFIDVAIPNRTTTGGFDWYPAQWSGLNRDGVPLVKWLFSEKGKKEVYGPDEDLCRGTRWPELVGKRQEKWDWLGMQKRFRKALDAPISKNKKRS
jgi:hypothetical protein